MYSNRIRLASTLNRLWRPLARHLVRSCSTCGQPRLYSIFDAYVSGTPPRCPRCWSAFHFTRPLIKYIFSLTNLQEDAMKGLMGDVLMRKTMHNVVKSIAYFGVRIPQPTAVPVVIVWNYTNRCNLTCLHCHQRSGVADERELSTGEVFRVIERLGEAGISVLTFSGGEPLLRPDIYDAIARATDREILCTIASNGTLMTQPVVQRLARAGVRRVEIGLDGCHAKTHDYLRNTPGAFNATLQGIKHCVDVGFDEICVTMTLHTHNVDELPDTVALAENLGVHRFYLNRLIPAGRGVDVMDLDVTRDQRIEALEYLYQKFHDSVVRGEGIQCYARGMTYYGRLGYERSKGMVFTVSEALSGYSPMWRRKFGDGIAQIVRSFAPGFGGCSAGTTYAGLTPAGDLIPCVPAPIPLGNLLETDLEDLWVHHPTLNYLRRRRDLKGACGRCHYKEICGGCRYTAYVVHGDWLAADPSCPYGPRIMAKR